jgi:hypothetical protein
MKYEKCKDCPASRVIPDPDPSDSWNFDDVAIVCCHTPNPTRDLLSKYAADRQEFRKIDVGLRPYQLGKVEVPEWCPLNKN